MIFLGHDKRALLDRQVKLTYFFKQFKPPNNLFQLSTPLFQIDRAERHDLKSQLWLFFSPFLFPSKKKKGIRKGE